MSFIEVIGALALLAVFGSSLFMVQEYLFDRMSFAQKKLLADLHMQSELVVYQTNILNELFAQQGPVEKSLKERVKEFSRPDMTVTITTLSDFDTEESFSEKKESSFKNFNNLHLITAQAEHNKKEYGKLYMFVYIPEVAKT